MLREKVSTRIRYGGYCLAKDTKQLLANYDDVPNNLDSLVRGGRISKTTGIVANILDIKPILDVKNGEMEVIAKVRGHLQSMKKVADILAQRVSKCVRQTIGTAHANNFEAAEKMRELLRERLPECEFLIEKIGGAGLSPWPRRHRGVCL